MSDRTVRLVITGDTKRAIAALEEMGVRAELVGRKVESAFGDRLESAASKSGGALSRLSNTLGAWGIPFTGSLDKMSEKISATQTKGQKFGTALAEAGKVATLGIVAGAAVIGSESVKMAGTFQQQMSKLVTSGGETARNLSGDMSGVLKLMGQTGTSSSQLAAGLYTINSAGFHGADGLTLLKAAAQGAKTENANLTEVTDGLTTLMNDYHVKASDAALVTSKMVTATSLGKTTFQDLAGSLHTVAPAADAAGLSMDQVLGAMATMTGKGTPAADAATYLRQTILQLSNPSAKAANEMASLGLNAVDVSKNLGSRGLTGTLDLLTNAIAKKMGPSGTVLIDQMKAAAAAGSGWQAELAKMTPAQQAQINTLAAQGVQMDKYKQQLTDLTPAQRTLVNNLASGTTNTVSFQRAFAQQSPAMQAHLKDLAAGSKAYQGYQASVAGLPAQYRTVLNGSIASKEGFRDLTTTIAQLPPAQQTAVGALADMVGGTKSMQAALELTGGSAATFQTNIGKVAKTSTEAGGNVAGWSTVQKNFNQQLSEAQQTVDALGIKLGLALIPKLEGAAHATMDVVTWFEKHKAVAEALAGVIGGTLALAVGAFTVNKIAGLIKGVSSATQAVGGLISKITGIGGGSGLGAAGEEAAGPLDSAATKLQTAADQIAAAAEKLSTAGATAGSELESGAATAQADLVAGGSAAESDLAAGGATARSEEATGGLGGLGGEAGVGGAGLSGAGAAGLAAGGVAAVGVGGLAYGMYKLFQNDQNVDYGSGKYGISFDAGTQAAKKIGSQAAANNLAAAGSLSGLAKLADLPHRALGGPVMPGQAYLVGENGPEIAQFGSPGTIIPNSALRGASSSVPSSTSTVYQIETLQIVAQNPAEFEQQLQQRARVSAMAGGSSRRP